VPTTILPLALGLIVAGTPAPDSAMAHRAFSAEEVLARTRAADTAHTA
jgi:hypothetical protein